MENKNLTKWDLWLLAMRPKTLPAAVAPVLVGSAAAFADGFFHPLLMLVCLLGALLLQIAVNFANDYFDAKNDIDSAERLGPVRVTQSGLIPAIQVKWAMILALFLAVLVFSYLSLVAGWPIVLVMIASVLGALGYSGGPYPLASNGLGEIFVFIFFGIIAVCGTYFIVAGHLVTSTLLVAIPPGLLITAIMVINNLRDIDTDSRSGKKTLAVILGRSRTILEYRLLLLGAYLVPLVMFVTGTNYFILMPFLSLPLAIKLWAEVERCLGSELNVTLAKTAKLSLMFSLGFAVGLVLGA